VIPNEANTAPGAQKSTPGASAIIVAMRTGTVCYFFFAALSPPDFAAAAAAVMKLSHVLRYRDMATHLAFRA